MARLLFPDEAGRIAFSSGGQGSPLRSAADVAFIVYADEACTTPADITDMAGDPIVESIIIADHESLLPYFHGPDDDQVHELWILQASGVGTVSNIFARPLGQQPDMGAVKGFMNHGDVEAAPRPPGYVSVEWYGLVVPVNAIAGDTWVDTSV